MEEYSEAVVQYFLEHQSQLYDEPVAETLEEAEVFLEENFAVVLNSIKECRNYLDDMGLDVIGLSDRELQEMDEVFSLPDGRFLLFDC
ncbi:MAG: glyoxalase [Lachnospiraceae bacterium]|nr:glyoxalase [Lachnospiraceae bacterium]